MTAAVTAMIALMIYFLPAAIAKSKHRENVSAIFALNLILGWTVIGWIAAFIWALTEGKPAT